MPIEKIPITLKAKVALFFSKKLYCLSDPLEFIAIRLARRKQKNIIKNLIEKDESSLDESEKRIVRRNYYIDKINATYTVLRNNTVIITRTLHLKVFEDGDLIYTFIVKPDNFSLPNSIEGIVNNLNRFSEFSFSYSLLETSRKSNRDQNLNCEINIEQETNTFFANITIKSCQKNQKIVLSLSVSVPNEINQTDQYPIMSEYKTPVGVWEFVFQEEIYGNNIPRFTANIEDERRQVYFPLSYKNIYYSINEWKIRHKWKEDGKIIFKIRSV